MAHHASGRAEPVICGARRDYFGQQKAVGAFANYAHDQLRANRNVGKQMSGAIVLQVDRASPGAERGVKDGDVIVEVAQDPDLAR